MPYIKKEDRELYETSLEFLFSDMQEKCSPGDLNYIITSIIKKYLNIKGENYTHYNDIMGVLEGAKLEFYRRSISAYEDIKIIENGDL
jgi:hypothetical protein